MTVFKDVLGYEGIYQVSDTGIVRSVGRERTTGKGGGYRNGVVLKHKINTSGYATVHLRWKAQEKESWPNVHRLVALAFLPNPEDKPTVNHIDGDKLNNNLHNLEWATYSEQTIHAFKEGLMKVRGNTLYSLEFKEGVAQYYKDNDISIKGLSRKFGFSEQTASRIVGGKFGDARRAPKELVSKALWLREQGYTLKRVGEIVGKDLSTVHNWVSAFEKRGYVYV